jgi:hypothetical protein
MGAPDHPLGPLAPLAAHKQFVVARRANKVPVSPTTGRRANAQDPANWRSYEDAARLVSTWGPEEFGIGFVLTESDDLGVIDIDDALQEDGTWKPHVDELRRAMPGAVEELSQSGRGVHLWFRSAKMPEHAKKNIDLHIECYTSGRYMLLGSNPKGMLADDCPGAPEVVARYFPVRGGAAPLADAGPVVPDPNRPEDDDVLIACARKHRTPAQVFAKTDSPKASFEDLWTANEDALAHAYPSDRDAFDRSAADSSLACRLVYRVGPDAARVERLMRASGLARDKYSDHSTYLARTIKHSIASVTNYYRWPALPAPAQSFVDVLGRLRELELGEVMKQWLPLTLPLSPVERDFVIDYMEGLGLRRQALKAELREADEKAKRARGAQDLARRAGGKLWIAYRPEVSTELAAQIEAAIVAKARPGEYVSFGGVLSQVASKHLPNTHFIDDPEGKPPAVPQIEPLDAAAMLQRTEAVAVLYRKTLTGDRPMAVPDRMVNYLLNKRTHAASAISGLVTHPLVLHDGTILAGDGLHAPSGLFLQGATAADMRPYSHTEARAAVERLRKVFLEGFEFASALDVDVALAGLFTGVQRRLLDTAPGLAILASTQSSGKTTLARRIHVVLAGRDMPVSTFPMNDEAEAAKRLLSSLLRSPTMIVFDNVPDGFTFSSGSLAAAMTSSVFEQRVLGISRDASVPTRVLFVLTGNNLTLGNDEVTRWMVTRLAPACPRPHERQFHHPDVVSHALVIREQVLRDVVGIVAGYIVSGASCRLSGTRYPEWDRLVRQPLVWAGAADVAAVFTSNAEQSEPVRAHRTLLWALRLLFGDEWFTSTKVAIAAVVPVQKENVALRAALEALRVRHVDRSRSVSHALTAAAGRIAEVDEVVLRLVKSHDNHTKLDVFKVEQVGAAARRDVGVA